MSKFSELIYKEDGFLVGLHCENVFDTAEYGMLKRELLQCAAKWRSDGHVPLEDVAALTDLVDELAGDSGHYDDETAVLAENARIEVQEIINSLR